MRWIVAPLVNRTTYTGACHALAGIPLAAPFLAVSAVVVAAARTLLPVPGAAAAGAAAGFAAAVLVGGVRSVRGGCTVLARALLGADLPVPAGAPARRRCATACWVVTHLTCGAVLASVLLVLAGLAVGLPASYLGGDTLAFGSAEVVVPPGLPGLWAVPASLAAVVAAGYACAAGTAVASRAAVLLLGPTADERFQARQRQAQARARRNRLAGDLHDSIGHVLATTVAQATAAGLTMDRQPALARSALAHIERSSRTALADLDHVLALLRDDPPAATPATGNDLTHLPDLLATARRTGVAIHQETVGELSGLPASVSREAFRTIQEGLTNAMRHAPGAPVTLRLAALPGRLDIELTNPLPAVPVSGRGASRRGHGLTGMTERTTARNGTVTAAPAGLDGTPHWRLAVSLPLPARP
jgi:signal transduction histidine kinase